MAEQEYYTVSWTTAFKNALESMGVFTIFVFIWLVSLLISDANAIVSLAFLVLCPIILFTCLLKGVGQFWYDIKYESRYGVSNRLLPAKSTPIEEEPTISEMPLISQPRSREILEMLEDAEIASDVHPTVIGTAIKIYSHLKEHPADFDESKRILSEFWWRSDSDDLENEERNLISENTIELQQLLNQLEAKTISLEYFAEEYGIRKM